MALTPEELAKKAEADAAALQDKKKQAQEDSQAERDEQNQQAANFNTAQIQQTTPMSEAGQALMGKVTDAYVNNNQSMQALVNSMAAPSMVAKNPQLTIGAAGQELLTDTRKWFNKGAGPQSNPAGNPLLKTPVGKVVNGLAKQILPGVGNDVGKAAEAGFNAMTNFGKQLTSKSSTVATVAKGVLDAASHLPGMPGLVATLGSMAISGMQALTSSNVDKKQSIMKKAMNASMKPTPPTG